HPVRGSGGNDGGEGPAVVNVSSRGVTAIAAPPNRRRPRHQHSPRVRRLAAEIGVALESLTGTGPGGRVTTADVSAAAVEPVRTAPPLSAQLTTVVEVDVTSVVDRPVSPTAFVAKV